MIKGDTVVEITTAYRKDLAYSLIFIDNIKMK